MSDEPWVCRAPYGNRAPSCKEDNPHAYCQILHDNEFVFRKELDEEERRITHTLKSMRQPQGLWALLKRGWL